jgi:hypothetical protein
VDPAILRTRTLLHDGEDVHGFTHFFRIAGFTGWVWRLEVTVIGVSGVETYCRIVGITSWANVSLSDYSEHSAR